MSYSDTQLCFGKLGSSGKCKGNGGGICMWTGKMRSPPFFPARRYHAECKCCDTSKDACLADACMSRRELGVPLGAV